MASSGTDDSGTRSETAEPATHKPASTAGILLLLAAILGADQLTKLAVVRTLGVGESWPVVDGLLWISHVRNSGAAFSLFRGSGTLLGLAALVGVAILVTVIVRRPPRLVGYAAALVAAGALGNLTDRLVRGTVVDFVDLQGRWPAFNVADSAITIGVLLLVLTSGRRGPRDAEADVPG